MTRFYWDVIALSFRDPPRTRFAWVLLLRDCGAKRGQWHTLSCRASTFASEAA